MISKEKLLLFDPEEDDGFLQTLEEAVIPLVNSLDENYFQTRLRMESQKSLQKEIGELFKAAEEILIKDKPIVTSGMSSDIFEHPRTSRPVGISLKEGLVSVLLVGPADEDIIYVCLQGDKVFNIDVLDLDKKFQSGINVSVFALTTSYVRNFRDELASAEEISLASLIISGIKKHKAQD